jgi:barstar (barnase inhibitor)
MVHAIGRWKHGSMNFPVFVDDVSTLPIEHAFVLKVKKGIQSKADLLLNYEIEGSFPGYFGHNWDALLDCLRDFSWVSQKRIIIAHDDLPLKNDEEGLRIYLEILETAVKDWNVTGKSHLLFLLMKHLTSSISY